MDYMANQSGAAGFCRSLLWVTMHRVLRTSNCKLNFHFHQAQAGIKQTVPQVFFFSFAQLACSSPSFRASPIIIFIVCFSACFLPAPTCCCCRSAARSPRQVPLLGALILVISSKPVQLGQRGFGVCLCAYNNHITTALA